MIREYVMRYAKARGISEDEAYRHKIVREVCNFYADETFSSVKTKQIKEKIHAAGNEYIKKQADGDKC